MLLEYCRRKKKKRGDFWKFLDSRHSLIITRGAVETNDDKNDIWEEEIMGGGMKQVHF